MKRVVVPCLALGLAFAATAAFAQDGYYDDYDRGYDAGYEEPAYAPYQAYGREGGAATDMARVLSVDPIVEPAREVRRQECWREPAPRYAYEERYERDSYYAPRRTSGGGAVLGAIVGGALGNTVGDGDGRRAATVVGAVVGGAIGNDIERNGARRDDRYYRQARYSRPVEVERCRVVTDVEHEGRVVGYRVAYEYAGRVFHTTTDYHPGDQLRVRVDVTPEG